MTLDSEPSCSNPHPPRACAHPSSCRDEKEIIYHGSHNVGVAMDTAQGLVVPNEGEVEGSIVMVHPYLDPPGGVLARHTTDRDRSQGSTHRLNVHSNHLGRMHA